MKVSDFSIKHPVIITIILIAVLFFGAISLIGMRQELFADVSMPSLLVLTIYPGAGPSDVEREVTNPLEEEISMLSGIDSIESTSADSVSMIWIEFVWEVDTDIKIAELREKINSAASKLPSGITGSPQIMKIGADALSIFTAALDSEMDKVSVSEYLENRIIPRIARIPGVSFVGTSGESEMLVDVQLKINEIAAKNISILNIYQLLQYNNISFPAGTVVYQGEHLNVRTQGQFNSLEEIRSMVIGYADNSFIRLSDVAEISLTEKKPTVYVDSNGKSLIVFYIQKQIEGDTIRIIREVKKILRETEQETSGNLRFSILTDSSYDIKLAINAVRNAAFLGALFAIIILILFLHNVRATIIIGISIPLSVLLAFIIMALKGQSINIMTLGGMTVAIGMIVDSSIVVLENTHRHFVATGDRKKAASLGASEVGGAIIASTTTSLAVFIPLLTIKGFAGVILKDIAFTIIWALSASLLVAIVVVPFLCAQLLKPEIIGPKPLLRNRISMGIDSFFAWLTKGYKKILLWSLKNSRFVIFVALAILVLSGMAVRFLGFAFLSEADMNEINITIETPAGYTLEKTQRKMLQLEDRIRALVPEIENAVFYSGQSSDFGILNEPNTGYIMVRLVPQKNRERSIFEIIDILQKDLPENISDIDITIANGGFARLLDMASGGGGFVLEIYGNDFDKVAEAAKAVRNLIDQDPFVSKTSMNVSFNRQEMISSLSTHYMGNLGITPYEAAMTSRILFNGMEAGSFRSQGKSYPIFLNSQLAGEEITTDILNQLTVQSQSGKAISFSNFTELSLSQSVSTITHVNRMKSIMVTGQITNSDLGGASRRLTPKIEDMALPAGVYFRVAGSAAQMISTFTSLLYTLGIAVFLVYIVMVIQFERFTQPLIVMASVPFTLIGVIAGLLLFGSTLSLVSFMGIIALSGIVVNNAIVLIDYINLLRRRDGVSLITAVLEGGSSRLKPILMTTLTTILGVIPMALGVGEGSELYAPLGQSIGGGLITSTIITLILIPTLYCMLEERRNRRLGITESPENKGREEKETGTESRAPVKETGRTGKD